MNILLLNTNPVVSRLIALCLRDDEHLLEEVEDTLLAKRGEYDIVFVDDLSYVNEVARALEKLTIKNKVYLSSERAADAMLENFDEVIKKPFLPSQIIAVIERVNQKQEAVEDTEEEQDVPFIFPMSSEKEEAGTEEESMDLENEERTSDEALEEIFELSRAAEVLDSNEIEKIKALLDEDEDEEIELSNTDEAYEARKVEVITEHLEADGLEIISEDEIVDLLSNKEKKKKSHKEKKKKKQKNKKKKPEEETYSFEEALIAAIEGMKIKKIKKLLKDKDVHIRITVKDKK